MSYDQRHENKQDSLQKPKWVVPHVFVVLHEVDLLIHQTDLFPDDRLMKKVNRNVQQEDGKEEPQERRHHHDKAPESSILSLMLRQIGPQVELLLVGDAPLEEHHAY
jgi:hypothetical protein